MTLTERAQTLLEIVSKAGESGVTRKQIAEIVGTKQLSQGDAALLEILAVNNFIESFQVEDDTPIGYKWVYRVKE